MVMKQWAIAIGISHYPAFPPLNSAQHDAQALRNYLVQAGFAPERCLLLTDTSPPLRGKSTRPTRETVHRWLTVVIEHCLQPGDSIWVFFSGYGVCQQGQDYFLPIDADPQNLPTTAISLASLYDRLNTCAAEHKLVLLDLRSQGLLSPQLVGQFTQTLASEAGIPTILADQPSQVFRAVASQSDRGFTAALLAGLRSTQGLTLADLDHDLRERYLRERSPHQSDPARPPVPLLLTIGPLAALQRFQLPGASLTEFPSNAPLSGQIPTAASQPPSPNGMSRTRPAHNGPIAQQRDSGSAPTNGYRQESRSAASTIQRGLTPPPPLAQMPLPTAYIEAMATLSPQSAAPFASSALPANQVPANQLAVEHDSRAASAAALSSGLAASSAELADAAFWRSLLRWGSLVLVLLLLGVLVKNWKAFSLSGKEFVTNAPPAATPANPAASTTPPPATTQRPATQQPNSAAPNDETRSLLEAAKAKTLPRNQATLFWNAIQAASQIQPGQPHYGEAQQEIAGWSRDIWNLAKQRSRQKSYDAAILAATLVPENQPVYADAQVALQQWCQLLSQNPGKNPIQNQQAKAKCEAHL